MQLCDKSKRGGSALNMGGAYSQAAQCDFQGKERSLTCQFAYMAIACGIAREQGEASSGSVADNDESELKADAWLRNAEACQQDALKLASGESTGDEVQQADKGLQARALKAIGVCMHTRGNYTAGLQLHRLAPLLAQDEFADMCSSVDVHFSWRHDWIRMMTSCRYVTKLR
jgi:hypothetical protein